MPPKRAASTKKATPSHASYRDMIKDAILNLKERNGSSRQSIKRYVLANNKITFASQAAFDSQFNKAIKTGVEKGEFTQPKGSSGPVKLAKKEPAAKPAAKKATTTTPKAAATPKKAAAAPKKAAAAKKTDKTDKTDKTEKTEKAEKPAAKATTTKKAPGRPKANTAKPRKASTVAPAIVDQPKVISTTKSGRVTKTTAKPVEKTTRKRATKATKAKTTAAKKAEKSEA